MNTKFNKEDFTWDGMYLMYRGDFNGSQKILHDFKYIVLLGDFAPRPT